MKRSVLLIAAMLFFMAEAIFAGSIATQRVVNACGFIKGSTTLNLSGQMNDAAMQSISDGNPMAVYNSLDSYLTFPTLFPKTKAGYGTKIGTQNVSVKTKNGKFQWTEKDVTPYFTFVTGEERIRPDKAVLKSKGTIDTSKLAELETKRLTVFDQLCADQSLGYLASLVFSLQPKGKNYKFSCNFNDIQAKVSVNSKGKATAKYTLSPEAAYPAILESEYIFTNKYDYSLEIIGDGDVYSGYCEPDKVEFRVTKNPDKFRYFLYKGTKVTNDFMTLELLEDTEVQAVFGTYDFSLKIVGEGSASAEFVGPDEVEVKVTENKDRFRNFTVNGERCPDSEMTLVLEEDTLVEAIFGNYALNVTISGKGSVSYSFIGSEEVVVTAIPGEEFFKSFEWEGNISYDNPLKLTLTKDTELLATFKKAEEEKYIVVDLSGGPDAELYPVSLLDDVPEGGWTEEYKTTKLVLRRIEPGTFTMGSPTDELGRYIDETQHQVTLTNAYYIGVFETTQKQYELITGSNPSYYKGDVRPVENVSYNMIRGKRFGASWPYNYDVDEDSFFGKLRSKTQMTFDLPTEAQWEMACRAGTTTALNSGKDLTNEEQCQNMDEVGRYSYNGGSDNYHAAVGSYLPNSWGLYDMHGNVYEWCLDWYQSDLGSDPVTEPLGASLGNYRVLRGGSWYYDARYCRSANRADSNSPSDHLIDGGFRVVLVQNVFSGQKNKKDFEFEIKSGTENTLPVFEVKLFGKLPNGTEKPLNEMGKIEYDGASGIVVGAGIHKLTWIPDAAFTNIMDEVELRVEYEDVTEQAAYLVLNTTSNKMRVSSEAPDTTDNKCRTDELWLRRIEPGTFAMGSPEDELGRSNEEIQHEVTLTKAYYIGVFETTQKQFQNIFGENPSYNTGDMRPVEEVSYNKLRGFAKGFAWPEDHGVDEWSFMGQLRKKAGNVFDLPTEAQWEYACRAGTTTALNDGNNITNTVSDGCLAKLARYYCNRDDGKGGYGEHTTVGSYLPNAWGLYDMHGNMWEWCLDWYGSYAGPETDPRGASTGSSRVIRGGGWGFYPDLCRSATRTNFDPDRGDANFGCGFRVVITQ
jgi:formylglycine-generating enzyme required for sulfatase activity